MGRITVVHFYNPCLKLNLDEIEDIMKKVRSTVIWTGDFNAHGDLWGSDKTDANRVVVESF